MEESNDSTFKLRATAGVDCRGGKGLPDDRLTNVCSNEKRNSASKTVTLLKQFIEKNYDETSHDQLHNQEHADTSAEITWLAVETSKDEDACLAKGQDDGEEFLGGLVKFTVGLQVEVDVDEVGSGKELGQLTYKFFLVKMIEPEPIGHVPGKPCQMK